MRRVPTIAAAVVAVALVVVIGDRVTADEDPSVRDTRPIRIESTEPEPADPELGGGASTRPASPPQDDIEPGNNSGVLLKPLIRQGKFPAGGGGSDDDDDDGDDGGDDDDDDDD